MTTSARRSSLGATLGRWIGVSTALSLAVFAAAAALALQIAEEQEVEEDEEEDEEEPLDEAIAQVGMAMLFAAPLGVFLAVAAARWLAARAVQRVDAVIATATRMTTENLRERLPVSPAGDELDALAVALNGLFERLQDGVALQRQFAADASHELRSPLAVLSSTLEVARRRPRENDAWERLTDRALAEVQHMTRLVEALLQLTRAGTVPRSEAVEVTDLLHAVVDRCAASATQATVQVVMAATADVSLRIDRELVEVALGNVVANAIAHSPAGGEVRIETIAEPDAVRISVSDQGSGVPPHERERIFHPFVRGHVASADRGGLRVGLGLGLAIARRVVEGHGGQIFVEDRPGPGAVFTVRLPRVAVAAMKL